MLGKVEVGSMVKFSKRHWNDSPGHEYVKDWVGIIIEMRTVGCHVPIDEIKIMWTIHGASTIMHYDEIWWNNLSYNPFEVVYESR